VPLDDGENPFDTTEATETTRFSKAVATGALAITSIDVIGASANAKSSLRIASSEYDEDASNVRMNVYDPATEAIQQAGNILCFFNQANYIEMADQGPYVAQADMKACFKDKSSGGGQNKSAGSTKELVNVVVDSARLDEFSPLIVKAWFEMIESRGDSGQSFKVQMQVKMVIAEGQSEANPVGIFRLSWEGKVAGNVMMKGHIESSRSTEAGKINLIMVDASQQGPTAADTSTTLAVAQLDWDAGLKDVTGGRIRTSAPVWSEGPGPAGTQEFAAAFNDDYLLRSNVTKAEKQCLSKSDFDYSIYRYGLYNAADGTRKDLNSGFGVEATASDGSTAHGYAGYWGIWLPPNVSLTDGMTLTQREYGKDPATYTIKSGPGKLLKFEKASITLDELDGVELNVQDGIVVYSKATNSFSKIGSYGNKGIEYLDTPTAYSIQPQWSQGQAGTTNLWSQALGGNVIIKYNSAGAPLSPAAYFKQTNVTATQGNLTLKCLTNCLKTNVNQSDANGSNWVNSSSEPSPFIFFDFNGFWGASDKAGFLAANATTYTWDASNMVLKSGSDPATLAAGVKNGGYNSWGYQAGPLVESLAGVTNPWDLNTQDTYYMWETGSEAQNKFTRLIDSAGATVSFDAPLFIDYTHSKANDRSGLDAGTGAKYYGKKLNIQYRGFGQLWGIPSEPDSNGRWAPLFGLKDGILLGSSSQYKLRGLDGEIRLRPLAADKCGALSVSDLPDLPSLSSYKAPDLGAVPDGVAGTAPKVIEGVIVAK